MVNEILRAGSGAALVERHHHGTVEPGPGQQPQLAGLVGKAELRAVRAEETARMRLESDGKRRFSVGPAHLQGSCDDRAVAQMDAVEIAHGDDRPARDRVIGGGVADNGKTSCHYRGSWPGFCQDSLGNWVFRERGWTVTRRPLRSQAGRV